MKYSSLLALTVLSLAVMAISGEAIPEPSSLGLAAFAGLLATRRRR